MLAVLSLTNKYLFYEERVYEGLSSVNETYIFSAFWTGKEGTIYVEAFDETIVRNVVSGMNVFLSAYRNAFELIPVTDRTQLFDIPQRSKPLPLHAFVRVKGKLERSDRGDQIIAQEVLPLELNEEANRPKVFEVMVPSSRFSQGNMARLAALRELDRGNGPRHVKPLTRNRDFQISEVRNLPRKNIARRTQKDGENA